MLTVNCCVMLSLLGVAIKNWHCAGCQIAAHEGHNRNLAAASSIASDTSAGTVEQRIESFLLLGCKAKLTQVEL